MCFQFRLKRKRKCLKYPHDVDFPIALTRGCIAIQFSGAKSERQIFLESPGNP